MLDAIVTWPLSFYAYSRCLRDRAYVDAALSSVVDGGLAWAFGLQCSLFPKTPMIWSGCLPIQPTGPNGQLHGLVFEHGILPGTNALVPATAVGKTFLARSSRPTHSLMTNFFASASWNYRLRPRSLTISIGCF